MFAILQVPEFKKQLIFIQHIRNKTKQKTPNISTFTLQKLPKFIMMKLFRRKDLPNFDLSSALEQSETYHLTQF